MKFYRDIYNANYWGKIEFYKLNAVLIDYNNCLRFYENGKVHNSKNSAHAYYGYKSFSLKGENYGNLTKFNKSSWRKFVRELKMKVFL
jgi:hypothetical protein